MKWTPNRIAALKLGIFVPALIYMGIDLLAWHGPVWHLMYGPQQESRDTSGLAAEVGGEPITLAQLARHEAEQDCLAGRTVPQPARRASYLMEMVRATQLLTRTRYNDKNLPDCRAEAQAEVARLATRFENDAAFERALAGQGYTRQSYTDKLTVRLRERAMLERAIAEASQVSEDELAAAYESMRDELTLPARRKVSHIFLAILDKDAAAVKAEAEKLLARLQAGEDFAALARSASEDERSAPHGGALGELQDISTRPLPELPLFGEKAIPANVPTLAQSRWGWHILLAGETQPAALPPLDECRESLRSALASVKRELALREYFKIDLMDAQKKKRIRFHLR